jgi:hypothetical protein
MSSSYGRNKWPAAPAFIANLASQDVYANPLSPLSVIGGGAPPPTPVAPSGPPGVHEVYTPGAPGTYYYSIWAYDTAALVSTSTELACITALQVAP